jgi:hypothetical protein
MSSAKFLLILAIYAGVALMLFKNYRVVLHALENFRDNWPRGGGRPTHPSPANDSPLLTKRKRSAKTQDLIP